MSAPKIGLLCGDLDATRDGVADYAGRLAAHLAAIGLDPLLLTTYQLADATGGETVGVTTTRSQRTVSSKVSRSSQPRRSAIDHNGPTSMRRTGWRSAQTPYSCKVTTSGRRRPTISGTNPPDREKR